MQDREGDDKYPLYHNKCNQIIYYYDIEPKFGMRPCCELIHPVSEDQPTPKYMGRLRCHNCNEDIQIHSLLIDGPIQKKTDL